MRKYGWKSFKDLIFRNPAVVDQVGLQTCLTRLSFIVYHTIVTLNKTEELSACLCL